MFECEVGWEFLSLSYFFILIYVGIMLSYFGIILEFVIIWFKDYFGIKVCGSNYYGNCLFCFIK